MNGGLAARELDDVLELDPKRSPGRPSLPGGSRRISAHVDRPMWEEICRHAEASGRTHSETIRALLRAGLDHNQPKAQRR